MRDIKFRAYQPHSSLHRQPGMYVVNHLVFYLPTKEHPYSGEVFLTRTLGTSRSSEYLEDIHLMQYTGLKDRNGVEVYEGDIVYGRATWRGKHMATAEVKYQGGGFFLWGRLITDWYSHEVIGNIYENPELLK